MIYTYFIGIGASLLLTFAGAIYAYRCWMLWRHTSLSGVGVEVTKRSFLSSNFKLTLIVGGLNGIHVIFETAEALDLVSPPWLKDIFGLLYYLNIVAIMSVLLILSIMWYRLLLRVNRWDKRWIKPK